ncbi:MAG: translational GTPase TypA, partial [Pseudomonadota bacterium]
IEEATIDVDEDFSGIVVEKLAKRKGELVEMSASATGKARIVAHVPARGLIGYHGEFLTDTRGTGILNRRFYDWAPFKGDIPGRRAGVLISMGTGESVAYALFNLEERGRLFISSGEKVYEGMVIGEHSRDNDLEVNPLKGKKLTNIRATGKDDAVILIKPTIFSLEQAISYINDDELVEVTPNAIRIRKRFLDPHERKRHTRSSQAELSH